MTIVGERVIGMVIGSVFQFKVGKEWEDNDARYRTTCDGPRVIGIRLQFNEDLLEIVCTCSSFTRVMFKA